MEEKENSNSNEAKDIGSIKENNNETKEQENKASGSYITGIIGAIIGGFIATIPWVLTYVYGNVMLSALAIIIAIGEFYGYKLFKGKITKVLPVIIMVLSVIIVALTTFVVIPAYVIHSEGFTVSMQAIETLYENEEFVSAISRDAIIGVIFTILGASVITGNINKKIKEGKTENLELGNDEEVQKAKKLAIEKIKPIFEKYNAVEKENGILKEELNAEVNENNELKEALSYLQSLGIVKKSNGKFFYSVKAEEKQSYTKKPNGSKIAIIIAIVLVLIVVVDVGYKQYKNTEPVVVSDEVISFKLDKTWDEYSDYTGEGEWVYYKYINTPVPKEDEEIDVNDYSKFPAYLDIVYYEVDESEYGDIQTIKENMQIIVESLEEKPSIYESEIVKSKNGYDILKLKIQIDEEPEQIEYSYYIINGNVLAIIDAYSYNLKDSNELQKTIDKVANSFEWKE